MGDVIEILTTATTTVEVEAAGPQGIPGVGVPTGGSALQVLRKKTSTDYDTEWAAAGSGSGSVTSVALASTDLTISGSPITESGTITANLAANAVTLEKLQTISSEHLLGRHGSGNGGVQQIGLGTGLAMSGSNVGVTFGSSAGTACQGNDSRLSDSRTPSSTLAHSSTHHTGGTDAIAPNQISAAWQEVVSSQIIGGNVLLSAGRNRRIVINSYASANIDLPASGNQAGDRITFVAGVIISEPTIRIPFPVDTWTASKTLTANGQSYTYVSDGTQYGWSLVPVDTHDHAASAITSGTLDIARIPTGTTSTTVALGNHTHTPSEVGLGNVSNVAQVTSVIGTAPIVSSGGTTPTISVTTGTTANTVAAGDDSRITGAAQKSANLSDLASASTARTNLGVAIGTDVAAASHSHGNLTSSGAIGSTAGLPVVTTTSGAVTTLALGTANQVLRVNSGATGVEFADPAAAGVTSVTGTAPIVSSGGTTPAISVTVGTGANTVAAGDDSRFHTRSHAITSTSDHTAGNHKVFYSDGSGQIQELALGSSGTVLTSNGATSAPSFAAASGGGVTGAAASASDVLGVSGANITGVDANADRIVYWNNTSNKLAYGTPADAGAAAASHTHTSADINSQTASNGHVLTANGSGGASFAALPASGISNVDSTLADVMSVSGSNLVADDGGLVDSSNPALVWDDAAGKAVWANPLRRTSAGAFYVGVAPTTTALGTDAINIQSGRSTATRVASGSTSIAIGNFATASGTADVAIGTGTQPVTASGSYSVAVGVSTTNHRATSTGAVALGVNCEATGSYGLAVGADAQATQASSVGIGYGAQGTAVNSTAIGFEVTSNLRSAFFTRPFRSVYWGGQTTNNTATILNLDATATNRFTIAASTALAVDILLVARRATTQDKWLVARRFLGIRRDGSNNTSLIGTVQEVAPDQSAGSPTWTYSFTADDTNEALQCEVTGAAGETVEWRVTAIYRVV